jgi:hypothetical protein
MVMGLFLGMTVHQAMENHTAGMRNGLIGVRGGDCNRIWEVYVAGKGTIILGQSRQLPAS